MFSGIHLMNREAAERAALVGEGGFEVVHEVVCLLLIVLLHLVEIVLGGGPAVNTGVPADANKYQVTALKPASAA